MINNLTQVDVSNKTGISRTSLSRYESGKGGMPTLPILAKLAKVYKCKVKDFFEEPTSSNIVRDIQAQYGDPTLKQIHFFYFIQ